MHHVKQKHPAGHIIESYDKYTAPSIALQRAEHRAIPTLKGTYNGTARDLLAKDVWNLRNYTNAPNSAIKELIGLNKEMYPNAYKR
ncbi:hypothetical protein CVD25_20320 [Bacillus canaveralius]|uniref:Uncharacterized protein n=1 Tax=Bacillus canaveralius TaxID=1403243 RepID=A0A2N5GJK9_9BACI|nr:hypothetical protein CU635_15205 [Bacillus canaveralius]PLR90034.1 hypothetical protein CVD25_20320 [Bacillus canaveralius]